MPATGRGSGTPGVHHAPASSPQTVAIDEEPLDIRTSETTRSV